MHEVIILPACPVSYLYSLRKSLSMVWRERMESCRADLSVRVTRLLKITSFTILL